MFLLTANEFSQDGLFPKYKEENEGFMTAQITQQPGVSRAYSHALLLFSFTLPHPFQTLHYPDPALPTAPQWQRTPYSTQPP